MSAKNPNVFYELGVRQAFDKPTVLMIDDSTGAPFDVSSLRYVNYSKGMKYRDVKVAIAKLAETLKDTYAKRADKNEINSLIRLLELTSPAQLGQADLSAEAKANLLNELQYSEIMNAIQRIQQEQMMLLNEIKYPAPSNFDREYNNIIETNKIKITKRDIDEYFKRTLKNNNESFVSESKNT
ncbi:hypothetical protein [Aeromonas veronii]|uniref:hypothetical protein n=1 Tax=Aeromonas veronii TaxID=654 RepID=UPI0032EC07F3